jgi:CheY-like chemotaxis protein
MGKLLLVDDEEALALALEHKPDAILLDLRMPKYSGFELCQTFTSFSSTQLIPVIVVSGEAGAKTKEFCRELGAVAYFEKPVDFEALTEFIAKTLKDRRVERRSEVRVRLRVSVKLQGKDSAGNSFDIRTVTENVSKSGFLCACNLALENNAIVEVSMAGSNEELVGSARVVRSEWTDALYPRYGFQFIQKTGSWVLD